MAAPFILKVREELGLEPAEAAEILQISVEEYLAKENDSKEHFYTDQLKELMNWMTPKMNGNFNHFNKLRNQK
jgi:hypothetical protein